MGSFVAVMGIGSFEAVILGGFFLFAVAFLAAIYFGLRGRVR